MRIRSLLVALALPLRVYLGLVFLWACWYKIVDPYEFALSIATYDILPLGLINLMAITLPWIELITGLALIASLWTRPAALAVAGMMLMFLAALAIALSKDLQMSCGCFASAEAGDEIGALTLVRDLLWLLASVYVLVFDDGRFGLDRLWNHRHARQ